MHLFDLADGLLEAKNFRDQRLTLFGRAALRAKLGYLHETSRDEKLEVRAPFEFFRKLEEGIAVSDEMLTHVFATGSFLRVCG